MLVRQNVLKTFEILDALQILHLPQDIFEPCNFPLCVNGY